MHDSDHAALEAARAVLAGPTRQPGARRLPAVNVPHPPRRVTIAAAVVAVFLVGFIAGTATDALSMPPWSMFLAGIGCVVGFTAGLAANELTPRPPAAASEPDGSPVDASAEQTPAATVRPMRRAG